MSVRPSALSGAAAEAAAPPLRPDVHSGLRLYLQAIGKTPLLTLAEESALAGRIGRGDRAARDHMIQANLRLVVTIAKSYQHFGLPLSDLISEGNVGLIKAVERFDPRKGGKLSTYAAWWIKQSIRSALAHNARTIRLPVHVVTRIGRMRRAAMRLHAQLGRVPTDEELAAELQVPTEKVALWRSVSGSPVSLDAPIDDTEGRGTFGDIVPDETAPLPGARLHETNLVHDLQAMIDTLDLREAAIVRLRFGLDGGDVLTLEEVGHRFSVSRERIRQLERRALLRLGKAMRKHEAIRTREEIELQEEQRRRMAARGGPEAERSPVRRIKRAA